MDIIDISRIGALFCILSFLILIFQIFCSLASLSFHLLIRIIGKSGFCWSWPILRNIHRHNLFHFGLIIIVAIIRWIGAVIRMKKIQFKWMRNFLNIFACKLHSVNIFTFKCSIENNQINSFSMQSTFTPTNYKLHAHICTFQHSSTNSFIMKSFICHLQAISIQMNTKNVLITFSISVFESNRMNATNEKYCILNWNRVGVFEIAYAYCICSGFGLK